MATVTNTGVSAAEYLEFERGSELKHEYRDGEIIEVTGASREHILLVTNLVRILSTALLNAASEVYGNDMRVKVAASGRYVYPDVSVVREEPAFEDDCFDTLLNPTVIFEVLSDSTENYDRGEKFAHYRTVESLQEYFLVSQNGQTVKRYTKQPDGRWLFDSDSEPDALVELEIIDCAFTLADVYHKVPLHSHSQAEQHPPGQ